MNIRIKDLYTKVMKFRSGKETFLLAIDGGGGAGKSTLATALKKVDPNKIIIIHMDDFYRTSEMREKVPKNKIGGYWDCERVKNQILIPLYNNEDTQYQRYDWEEDKLAEWHNVPAGNIVIIEGCYSLINSLRDYYDFKIWVESPTELRLSRGIERDGEEKRYLWEELWMPAEEQYKEVQKPIEIADIIIDGTGRNGDINDLEVSMLKGFIEK